MQTDWWSFWKDASGFNLNKFEGEYEALRLDSGKSRYSHTRLRLNRLRRDNNLCCLETNVYKNGRPGGRGTGSSNVGLLQVLVECMPHLKGVIAHGTVATRYLDSIPVPARIKKFPMPHFIRVSFDSIDEVAKELR